MKSPLPPSPCLLASSRRFSSATPAPVRLTARRNTRRWWMTFVAASLSCRCVWLGMRGSFFVCVCVCAFYCSSVFILAPAGGTGLSSRPIPFSPVSSPRPLLFFSLRAVSVFILYWVFLFVCLSSRTHRSHTHLRRFVHGFFTFLALQGRQKHLGIVACASGTKATVVAEVFPSCIFSRTLLIGFLTFCVGLPCSAFIVWRKCFHWSVILYFYFFIGTFILRKGLSIFVSVVAACLFFLCILSRTSRVVSFQHHSVTRIAYIMTKNVRRHCANF